jgi:phospholipid N-methyltransferase
MKLLTAFLRDWRTTGSLVPSSRFLQEGMMARIPFGRVQTVVELGPGTGVITQAILNRLLPTGKLLAVDINEDFIARLRNQFNDPRLIPLHGSATELPALLEAQGLQHADCVVSGLPFASLPPNLRREIIESSVKCLGRRGLFVAFQYAPFALPPLLKEHFKDIRTDFVFLNVPPALVYSCRKPT